MNKRDRLERTIAGEPTDRVPVALWRHFPGDDQRAADHANAIMQWQHTFDWDFVNIVPANSFHVVDHGLQDSWQGDVHGHRAVIRRPIERSLDWTGLRALDPTRGALARQTECTKIVADELSDTVPVIVTIWSPLAQAVALAGDVTLLNHLRTHADRLHTGLNVLTDSTLRFLEAIRRLPISGICYVVNHACYSALSEAEYRTFGLPYDRKIIESFPTKWWFNLLNFGEPLPMFHLVDELITPVVAWRDREGEPDLSQGRLQVFGAVCGGLHALEDLHLGTPTRVRDSARDAMSRTNSRRLILSAGRPVPALTPYSNLRAARMIVEGG